MSGHALSSMRGLVLPLTLNNQKYSLRSTLDYAFSGYKLAGKGIAIMKLELLSENHIAELMFFEHENRYWFEKFIESRGNDFYSQTSIEQHIIENIQAYHLGKQYPAVVVNGGHIIGRVNLKNICGKAKIADVGYRVSESFSGRGVAGFGVQMLIEISKEQLNLNCLRAFVLENNPASSRVLEKQGFTPNKYIDNYVTVAGIDLSCTEYQLKIL